MRKLAIIICMFLATLTSAQRLQQAPWEFLRESVAAAESSNLIVLQNANWDQRAAQSRGAVIPREAQALLIAFVGDEAAAADPNDNTATVKFWMYRMGGPAQVVGTYTISIGGQLVVQSPRRATARTNAHWADTIAQTSEYWISTPKITQVVADNVATLYIPTYGAAYITAEVTALGTGLTLDVMMSAINAGPTDMDIATLATSALQQPLYTEDVATANPIVGTAVLVERDDVLSTVTPAEADNIGLRGTSTGALWVQNPIQTVSFAEQTWTNGDGTATKSPTLSNTNMYVSQMLVLINDPTNANDIDLTIVNADSVTLATINNMADNTNHFKNGYVSIQDFAPFAVNGTITCNLTNSAAVGGTSMTCTVRLEGR